MQNQEKTTIGFWPSWFIVLAGLLGVMVVDGNAWGTSLGMKGAGLLLSIFATGGYFFWRNKVSRAYLVRTGLEWTYGLTLLALFGSWILSADPRQGLTRITWLIAYMLLFYILADMLEAGLNGNAVVTALLCVSGFIILMAALETSIIYTEWWERIGTHRIMPPSPYRLISLIKHSNAMMGLANLCAPLALILFFRKKGISRLLLAVWLAAYGFVVPFSQSWGGWMGIAVWFSVLISSWLLQHKPFTNWKSISPRYKTLATCLGIGVFTSVSVVAFMLLTSSQQPYLYGSGVSIYRGKIWETALQIWLANPFFGVGPGQFGFGYLRAVGGIPPGVWLLHAYSLPIQILAEFGVVGEIALIALFVENMRWLRKRYLLIDDNMRWPGVAVIAGIAAWVVQMLVDDQTSVAVVMASLILLFAYFVNLPEAPLKRWPQVSNNFIIMPVLMLIIGGAWKLWAYAPLEKGMQSGECQITAPLFAKSMERDPNLSFYATQAGFAWARCGIEEGDEASLWDAHYAFERSVELQPDVSLVWANMAVADWQTERYHDKAIPNMQHAVALSPTEASYLLNLGWFYEQDDLREQAVSAYVKALEQQAGWAAHPFWQTSDIRKGALSMWKEQLVNENEDKRYWMQARGEIEGGDFQKADMFLAQAGWAGESDLAIAVTRGLLADAQGDDQAAMTAYKDTAEIVRRPVLNSSHQFMLTYNIWLNRRRGIMDDFVPGYIQLDHDYGQFAALEKLYTMYHERGDCQEARDTWLIWQHAVHGGAPEKLAPAPVCSE